MNKADRHIWELAAARLKEQHPDWQWVFWCGRTTSDQSPAMGHNAGVAPDPTHWPDGGWLVCADNYSWTVKDGKWVPADALEPKGKSAAPGDVILDENGLLAFVVSWDEIFSFTEGHCPCDAGWLAGQEVASCQEAQEFKARVLEYFDSLR